MEIIIKQLIYHRFDCNELLNHVSPNYIKDENLEWNAEGNKLHPFAEDMNHSDLVISIEDINEPHENYIYFFLKVVRPREGNRAYIINKVVFDKSLSDEFITNCVSYTLDTLINGDYTITDRLIARDNYPLSLQQLENTKQQVACELIEQFHLGKGEAIPDEMIERLLKRK